jgi:hypothetical protein
MFNSLLSNPSSFSSPPPSGSAAPGGKGAGEVRLSSLHPYLKSISDSLILARDNARRGKNPTDLIDAVLLMSKETKESTILYPGFDENVLHCALFTPVTTPTKIEARSGPTGMEYDVFFARNLYYPGDPAEFLSTFGISIADSRGRQSVTWETDQARIIAMVNTHEPELLELVPLVQGSFKKQGKTPDEAMLRLEKEFPSAPRREKVIELLVKCYLEGIYAPVGHFTKKEFNTKNMKKFFSLTGISPLQKAAIAKIFIQLEIGAKNGFSLNHYIKAVRVKSIVKEDVFSQNVGLLDYLFFSRMADDGYWIRYAMHYRDTIAGIASGANVAIKHKKKEDLKFDMYGDHNVDVGNREDPSWIPELNKENCSTVYYFLCVKAKEKNYKRGKEMLAKILMDSLKRLIRENYIEDASLNQAQNEAEAKKFLSRKSAGVRQIVSAMKVDEIHKSLPAEYSNEINLPFKTDVFTDHERFFLSLMNVTYEPGGAADPRGVQP